MVQFRSESGVLKERPLPEEVPVALSIGGSTHAVMLATPRDLEDFAIGLAFSERLISSVDDVESLVIETFDEGVDMQMRLAGAHQDDYVMRRRQIAGPVGCGLCGVESLALALPEITPLDARTSLDTSFPPRAMDTLSKGQVLGAEFGAMHGAALFDRDANIVAIREDVGRHNALDKAIGAALRQSLNGAGFSVAISSRISVELVQKAVNFGAHNIIGAASPTSLAVKRAKELNIGLVAPTRGENYWELVE